MNMNKKKIISIIAVTAICCSAFSACSAKQETAVTTTQVVEVEDADDDIKMTVSDETQATLEVADNNGNTLTVVPVYNTDGITAIAGYIEKAVDKNGKELDEKSYADLKGVVAMEINQEGKGVFKYTNDKKFISLEANCDEKGYIIALQDSIDIDGDKDTEEYFKVVTKLDTQNNLFIKLDKDENGKPINVTVTKEEDGTVVVTDETGKKQTAVDSKDSVNLIEISENQDDKKPSNNNGSNNSSSGNQNSNSSNNTPSDNEPAVDYTSIVLMDNGKVACDADNVTINEASALNGGTEVVIEGAGEHSKYYVTSQTSVFAGQLEFRFSVDEAVEVKVYNVDISTSKKTAIKFTNVDTESEKEDDTEEVAGDNSQSGTSAITPAPEVEFSITGTNSFKASGSGTNGTIYSECKLGIKGHGTANIDGGPNLSGICSTESIDIKNATLNITSDAKQGISCDKKVTVKGGATINIESLGDGIHCNKFETDPLETGETDSVINIKSISSAQGADGIDANDYIIIDSGKINVVSLTAAKYGLKVRNVNQGKTNGYFEINNGTVTAVGSLNSNLTKCAQKTLLARARQNTIFTVGDVVSASESKSFVCSPVNATIVTDSKGQERILEFENNIAKPRTFN